MSLFLCRSDGQHKRVPGKGMNTWLQVVQSTMEAPAPAQPTVGGSSEFWRRSGECRRRKAASPSIFQGVNLLQLQRLFQRSGDQRAEQRAELVWEHSDENKLTQALMGLRRGRSRRHRTGRGALKPVWLQAFGKMRINECDIEVNEDDDNDHDSEVDSSSADTTINAQCDALTDREAYSEQDSSQQASSPRSSGKQKTERYPEQYLHRILH
ncbi:arginine vasopressin-induced protein 1-like isoform X2 [Polyodon spathula]|uniref:arginine vasopressin-induced protein 1-like isoform X2 n=1 Tax=Polyodon spathula TaxID=7913 RepID=UPI001B7F741A|nr:arginine vasopressin-induced protein 1-like isoform X2 [Polyodon spathula]XP_041125069.1 arginine vasopressin-induced protein 1-like isoform X2 [Polyodon spathula]